MVICLEQGANGLHMVQVGLSPGDFVLDGDPASYPKSGGASPNFRPMSTVDKRLHGSGCHLVRR